MILSARQALVCAALTGWRGDDPNAWQCPMPERDILAWAGSYLGNEEGLVAAHADLVSEGLFHQVLYPIFRVPVYYCSYDERFLEELPTNIEAWIKGASIPQLKEFWNDEFAKNSDEFAEAWIYWGLCTGQGSQSSSSRTGPCLGPGCSWFIDGKAHCNWNLDFADVARTGWPDTTFLSAIADEVPDEGTITRSLTQWRNRAPELAWPKT